MIDNPQSDNLEEILAGYVLGDLNETELVWFNQQLTANPHLKERVAQLKLTLNLLPYSLPADIPQNNIRSQILTKTSPKPAYPKYRWGWIIGVVTVISTLLLGVNNINLRQQMAFIQARLEQQQKLIALLRQPNSQLVALNPHNRTVATKGSLFISPDSNTAVLTLNNLDALPGNKVYRLWAVSQDKKTGCANFAPNNRGEVYLDLSSDSALFDASSISITIEPRPNTEQPLGREFLLGSYAEI